MVAKNFKMKKYGPAHVLQVDQQSLMAVFFAKLKFHIFVLIFYGRMTYY